MVESNSDDEFLYVPIEVIEAIENLSENNTATKGEIDAVLKF